MILRSVHLCAVCCVEQCSGDTLDSVSTESNEHHYLFSRFLWMSCLLHVYSFASFCRVPVSYESVLPEAELLRSNRLSPWRVMLFSSHASLALVFTCQTCLFVRTDVGASLNNDLILTKCSMHCGKMQLIFLCARSEYTTMQNYNWKFQMKVISTHLFKRVSCGFHICKFSTAIRYFE